MREITQEQARFLAKSCMTLATASKAVEEQLLQLAAAAGSDLVLCQDAEDADGSRRAADAVHLFEALVDVLRQARIAAQVEVL